MPTNDWMITQNEVEIVGKREVVIADAIPAFTRRDLWNPLEIWEDSWCPNLDPIRATPKRNSEEELLELTCSVSHMNICQTMKVIPRTWKSVEWTHSLLGGGNSFGPAIFTPSDQCWWNPPLQKINMEFRRAVACLVIIGTVKVIYYERAKYESWNFNSGNYLFTTDTK